MLINNNYIGMENRFFTCIVPKVLKIWVFISRFKTVYAPNSIPIFFSISFKTI